MANVTTTTAASFIPEMWRDAILDYAERKFQLSPLVQLGGEDHPLFSSCRRVR